MGLHLVEAKGPAPEPDFTILVVTEGWDWASVIGGPVGSFNSNGAITDAGSVYYLDSYHDAAGVLWNNCVFVGEFGWFETALPAWPANNGEYPFGIVNGSGAYDGIQASGTTKARTREGFFWYEDDMTGKKFKWTYLDVSWTMKGFLSP
jgi:hypothetical protein